MAPPHPDSPDAVRELLERIAGSASVMLYRAEYGADGSYTCTQFVGAPLESLVGPIPPDLTPEEAWDACIHPDDAAGPRALSTAATCTTGSSST